jgi:hypothetical protein
MQYKSKLTQFHTNYQRQNPGEEPKWLKYKQDFHLFLPKSCHSHIAANPLHIPQVCDFHNSQQRTGKTFTCLIKHNKCKHFINPCSCLLRFKGDYNINPSKKSCMLRFQSRSQRDSDTKHNMNCFT